MQRFGEIRRRSIGGVALAAAAAALVGAQAVAAAPHVAPSACAADATTQLREAGPYLVTLAVGPVPRMYTVAQAHALKPKSGVVMLEPMRGATAAGMMGQAGGSRHIRVQVCDRASGKALASPRPVVQVTQAMLREHLPLTRGYDIGTPPSQVRFCQVAVLPAGSLGVSVQVGSQSVAFVATV